VIGLDTNVLVRYIAQDDPAQSARATACVENECSPSLPGFVALIVLVEVVWVCDRCYGATRAEIAEILRTILSSKQLVVQDAETAWQALRLFESTKPISPMHDRATANAAGASGSSPPTSTQRKAGWCCFGRNRSGQEALSDRSCSSSASTTRRPGQVRDPRKDTSAGLLTPAKPLQHLDSGSRR